MPKKDELQIRAFRDFVWIKPAKFEVSRGGLFIPDTAQDEANPLGGEVVAVGDGLVEGGVIVPLTVKVGDYVRFAAHAGTLVKIGDEVFFTVRENQLFGAISQGQTINDSIGLPRPDMEILP